MPYLTKLFLMDTWVCFQLPALASEAVRSHLAPTSLSEHLVAQTPKSGGQGRRECALISVTLCVYCLSATPKATRQHLPKFISSLGGQTRLSPGQSLSPALSVFIFCSKNRFVIAHPCTLSDKGCVSVRFLLLR